MTSLDRLIAASNLAPAAVHEEIVAAFHMWEAAINITFREALGGESANILIGAQAEPQGWAFADISYDSSSAVRVKPIFSGTDLSQSNKGVGRSALTAISLSIIWVTRWPTKSAMRSVSIIRSASVRSWDIATRKVRSLQPGDIPGAAVLYGARSPNAAEGSFGANRASANAASQLIGSQIWRVHT
jgi:hypothetical protein